MDKIGAGWIWALGACLPFLSGGICAQQNIGNNVYICDGAAQAGPCQPEGEADAGYSGVPRIKWADRWGAYATDGKIDGIVAGKDGKRAAEAAAMDECHLRGGSTCRIVTTYYNQCFAIAASRDSSSWMSAETEDLALRSSMNDCNGKSGKKCFKYYSGCSLPERVQ